MTNVAALPKQVDIDAYCGDDLSMTIAVTNADGTPANLVGATILAQARQTPQSTAVAGTFTSSVSGNVITLALSHTITVGMTLLQYVWDCQVTYSSGQVQTVAG